MKRISYRGPYVTLGSPGNRIKPEFLLHGFVEVRGDSGQVVAVLQPGSVTGLEVVLDPMKPCQCTYVSVGDAILDTYCEDDLRSKPAIVSTVSQLLNWICVPHMLSNDKFLKVLSMLSAGKKLAITVIDLARVCGVSRIWATKILSDLTRDGFLIREDQYFWFDIGA